MTTASIFPRNAFLRVIVVAGALLATGPASASLGGARATVDDDRAHLGAALTSTSTGTYTVHALTLANGAVNREFVRPDGTVFAVTWRGSSRPDLRQLLGDRFAVLQSDNVGPGGRRTRRPLSVSRSDFVLRSGGHPGAFWGVAYLPGAIPAGFTPGDLRE
jgi:hypothetical protein